MRKLDSTFALYIIIGPFFRMKTIFLIEFGGCFLHFTITVDRPFCFLKKKKPSNAQKKCFFSVFLCGFHFVFAIIVVFLFSFFSLCVRVFSFLLIFNFISFKKKSFEWGGEQLNVFLSHSSKRLTFNLKFV